MASEAALAGIRDNGRHWRKKIGGVRSAIEAVRDGVTAKDQAAIEGAMRAIGAAFRAVFDEDQASSGELDALEWFEQETVGYEIQNGTLHEFEQEFDYRMNELYDWADYHRVLVQA